MVLYLCRMSHCVLHEVLWSYIGILMLLFSEETRSTTGPLLPSLCPYGTILLTLYSMVWDWRVSRAGTMIFNWPQLLYPFLSSTGLPFLSVYRLVVWSWGLWTGRVYIILSQPCTVDIFQ